MKFMMIALLLLMLIVASFIYRLNYEGEQFGRGDNKLKFLLTYLITAIIILIVAVSLV